MVSFYIYIYGICIVTDILLSWYGEFLYIYGICIVTDILLSWYGEFLYIYIYGICIVTDILLSWYGEFVYIYGICIVTDILLSWYGNTASKHVFIPEINPHCILSQIYALFIEFYYTLWFVFFKRYAL
jgi:hypothetical protein